MPDASIRTMTRGPMPGSDRSRRHAGSVAPCAIRRLLVYRTSRLRLRISAPGPCCVQGPAGMADQRDKRVDPGISTLTPRRRRCSSRGNHGPSVDLLHRWRRDDRACIAVFPVRSGQLGRRHRHNGSSRHTRAPADCWCRGHPASLSQRDEGAISADGFGCVATPVPDALRVVCCFWRAPLTRWLCGVPAALRPSRRPGQFKSRPAVRSSRFPRWPRHTRKAPAR